MSWTNQFTNSVPGFVEDLTLVRVPPWWENPWFLGAVLVLLVALALALPPWYRRRLLARIGNRAPARPSVPAEPVEAWALRRLEALRPRAGTLGHYRFTIAVSRVLRRYIHLRFGLPILFQTTREFLAAAQTSERLPAGDRERLGTYLEACDRVKFGRRTLTADEMLALIGTAADFVKHAAPDPASAPLPAPAEAPQP